jgi:hypothetical protein
VWTVSKKSQSPFLQPPFFIFLDSSSLALRYRGKWILEVRSLLLLLPLQVSRLGEAPSNPAHSPHPSHPTIFPHLQSCIVPAPSKARFPILHSPRFLSLSRSPLSFPRPFTATAHNPINVLPLPYSASLISRILEGYDSTDLPTPPNLHRAPRLRQQSLF